MLSDFLLTIQQHQELYKKYKSLDPKKRDAFYDKHPEKIELYENAKEYLTAVMNGKTSIPIKVWKAELEKLTAERFLLCDDYYRLKDEVKNVEVLRYGTESIIQKNVQSIYYEKNTDIEI